MAKDYGQRGEAAMRLMKKGKPPMEDDLGLPPEDEAMPPEEGGGDAGGLAALLQGAGSGAPAELPMEEAGGAPPMPEEGMGGPPDLDTALGGVESSLEGMPPETAEEIRVHINAIRELAAQGAPPMEPPMEAPPASSAPPLPDGGASGGAMNEEEV